MRKSRDNDTQSLGLTELENDRSNNDIKSYERTRGLCAAISQRYPDSIYFTSPNV